MRLKKYQYGGREGGNPGQGTITPEEALRRSGARIPEPGPYDELLKDYPQGGGIENTFGPSDYILGTAPVGRAIAPVANAIKKIFGITSKSKPYGVGLPKPNRQIENLQYAADRAIQRAEGEEVEAVWNLQAQLDDTLYDAIRNSKSDSERKIVSQLKDYFEKILKNPPPPSKNFQAHLNKLADSFKRGDFKTGLTDEVLGSYRLGEPSLNLTSFPAEADAAGLAGRKFFDPKTPEMQQAYQDLMQGLRPPQNFKNNENGGKIKVLKKR